MLMQTDINIGNHRIINTQSIPYSVSSGNVMIKSGNLNI